MDIGEIASPRKRGWEALVYRVAGLRRPRARRLHRMNSPTARACIGCCPPPPPPPSSSSLSPPPTSPSCTQQRPYPLACAVLYARGSYGAAIGEEAGDSRDAQVSHARRCCRATSDEEARHSLPRPSRAPPASERLPLPPPLPPSPSPSAVTSSLRTAFARPLQTHTISRVRSRARARAVGDSVRRGPSPPPPFPPSPHRAHRKRLRLRLDTNPRRSR